MSKNSKWLPLQKKVHEFLNRVDKEFDAALINMNSAFLLKSTWIKNLKSEVESDAIFRGESIQETLNRPCHIAYTDGVHAFNHQSTFGQIIEIAETPQENTNRMAGQLIVTLYQL